MKWAFPLSALQSISRKTICISGNSFQPWLHVRDTWELQNTASAWASSQANQIRILPSGGPAWIYFFFFFLSFSGDSKVQSGLKTRKLQYF